jgi:hypothetical protein
VHSASWVPNILVHERYSKNLSQEIGCDDVGRIYLAHVSHCERNILGFWLSKKERSSSSTELVLTCQNDIHSCLVSYRKQNSELRSRL